MTISRKQQLESELDLVLRNNLIDCILKTKQNRKTINYFSISKEDRFLHKDTSQTHLLSLDQWENDLIS